jgi:L,D-transpeptidase ErfK/SrfK
MCHTRILLKTALLIAATSALCAQAGSSPTRHVASQVVGTVQDYEVRPGDSLPLIGARFGVDAAVIAGQNGLKGSGLTPGQRLRIDARHIAPASVDAYDLIVNIPQRMLFHVDEGVVQAAYPVAVGRAGWPTPIGEFTIIETEEHPVWDVPVSIQQEMRQAGKPVTTIVPAGPGNPLGDYFLRLSFPSIGLHGTAAPSSIYRFATHGCIRLHPDDVACLFRRVDVGTRGRLEYAPILLAETSDGIFIEAHPDPYRRGPADALRFVHELSASRELCERIDWNVVEEALTRRQGVVLSVSLRPSTF